MSRRLAGAALAALFVVSGGAAQAADAKPAPPQDPHDDHAGTIGVTIAFAGDVYAIGGVAAHRYIATSGLVLDARARYAGEAAQRDPPKAAAGQPQLTEKQRVTGEAIWLEAGIGWALASWYTATDVNTSSLRCIANCEGWSPEYTTRHHRVVFNSLQVGAVYWSSDLLAIHYGAPSVRYALDWRRGGSLDLVRLGALGAYNAQGLAYGGDISVAAFGFLRIGAEYRHVGDVHRFEVIMGYEWGGNDGVRNIEK